MPRLPTVRPHQAIRALERAGFEVDHQTGSHIVVTRLPEAMLVLRGKEESGGKLKDGCFDHTVWLFPFPDRLLQTLYSLR
jgi:predicted RNA binding protein YcfA (HicA-like mRNA interferase family)